MKDSYLVSYELDYRLRQYEACIRGYQKCLEFMRDNMKKARERRVYQKLTDDHYYWHLTILTLGIIWLWVGIVLHSAINRP